MKNRLDSSFAMMMMYFVLLLLMVSNYFFVFQHYAHAFQASSSSCFLTLPKRSSNRDSRHVTTTFHRQIDNNNNNKIFSQGDNDIQGIEAGDGSSSITTTNKSSSSNSSSVGGSNSNSNSKSLLQSLDEMGQSFKARAIKASAMAAAAATASPTTTESSLLSSSTNTTSTNNNNNNNNQTTLVTKWKFLIQSCLYYTLFIIYRAYRGFFIILPAVYREVYRKLETVIESPGTVFALADNDDNDDLKEPKKDINKPSRFRVRVTINVITSIVTMSYVLNGAWRVLIKFISNIIQTSSISDSFAAAVKVQEGNEMKIIKHITTNNNRQQQQVNGEQQQ